MKRRRHKPIGFFLVGLCDVASGYSHVAVWAEDGSVPLGEVYRTVYDSLVIHFDKVTLADFLVVGDKGFAVSAAHF